MGLNHQKGNALIEELNKIGTITIKKNLKRIYDGRETTSK